MSLLSLLLLLTKQKEMKEYNEIGNAFFLFLITHHCFFFVEWHLSRFESPITDGHVVDVLPWYCQVGSMF